MDGDIYIYCNNKHHFAWNIISHLEKHLHNVNGITFHRPDTALPHVGPWTWQPVLKSHKARKAKSVLNTPTEDAEFPLHISYTDNNQ